MVPKINLTRSLLLVSLTMPLIPRTASAQDAKGCKDLPQITRFPGSVITGCKDKEDDSFQFNIDGKPKMAIEGEFHQVEYQFPKTGSNAQVVRNLNTALHRAGYTFCLRFR